jgi:hypothetical protein
MANGSNLATWLDLQQNPLGKGTGDPDLTVPSNYAIPPARIYVVNHTRTKSWKRLMVAISERRGAEEALIYDKELAKIYNVDTLTRAVERGKNMNRYKVGVFPIVFTFKVGSPIGGKPPLVYAIPPARDNDSSPPRVEVVEGAWDLFLGNYKRMRSEEPNVVGEEKSRHALRWSGRHNPVKAFTDDGVTTELDNPYGFLEFIRETVKPVEDLVDREYLMALDLVES